MPNSNSNSNLFAYEGMQNKSQISRIATKSNPLIQLDIYLLYTAKLFLKIRI